MRDSPRYATAYSAPSHMECPSFRRILQAVASGAIGVRRKACNLIESGLRAIRTLEDRADFRVVIRVGERLDELSSIQIHQLCE